MRRPTQAVTFWCCRLWHVGHWPWIRQIWYHILRCSLGLISLWNVGRMSRHLDTHPQAWDKSCLLIRSCSLSLQTELVQESKARLPAGPWRTSLKWWCTWMRWLACCSHCRKPKRLQWFVILEESHMQESKEVVAREKARREARHHECLQILLDADLIQILDLQFAMGSIWRPAMKKSNQEGAAKVFIFAQYLVVANLIQQLWLPKLWISQEVLTILCQFLRRKFAWQANLWCHRDWKSQRRHDTRCITRAACWRQRHFQ